MGIKNFISEKINLYELSYDCALLILPVIIERVYDTAINRSILGMPFTWLFLMLAVYTLPILIGRMYFSVFRESSPAVKKTVITILFTVTIFAYGNLVYLVMLAGDDITRRGIFTFIASTVLLIMGSIAGLAFGSDYSRENENNVQVIVFLFTTGLLPLFFMLISARDIFGDINSILLFIIVSGFCVLDAVLIMVLIAGYMLIKGLLRRTGLYSSLAEILKLVVPFSVSFIMVVFNIYTDRLFTGPGGIHGTGQAIQLVLMYTLSGVLPLRLIMMVSPPVRGLNIAMGITAAVVMIWMVSLR